MTNLRALGIEDLYKPCDPAHFNFETTADLQDIDIAVGQQRALDSMHFGMGIGNDGYNIFALGPTGMGKYSVVRQLVEATAAQQAPPPDWVYVNNFSQPEKPTALRLPTGQGVQFRNDMEKLVDELHTVIPAVFDSEDFRTRIKQLEEELKERQSTPLNQLREQAKQQRIALLETPTGFAFAPLDEKSEVLSPDEFNQLPKREQERIEATVAELHKKLEGILRQIPSWRKETQEKIKAVAQEIARYTVDHLIDALKQRYADLDRVIDYLDQVERDVVEHVERFRIPSDQQAPFFGTASSKDPFKQYEVNLIVDQSKQKSAPVVYEDLPTHSNLTGRCEHQAQMGTLVTDFTMIKPGALHRGNGGYLILDARKLLLQPYAWATLKRTLQSSEIRIEALERTLGFLSTATLEPDPIPLDIKVALFGDRLLYYLLQHYDPEFRDLFKVAADFEETVDRGKENNELYARLIASIARHHSLRPLDRSAVMRTIEHNARLAGDADKLSVHLRSLSDLLCESDYWANQSQHRVIAKEDVERAIDKQVYRANRIQQRVYEEIRRGTMLIDTQGQATAQVNGLAVVQLGEFSFGRPTRITATTRLGEGEVIDIEALHSKGVLILSSFLASRYARGQPLSMTASLVFEQSYSEVEGDSASLAELCALLSSLADLPIGGDRLGEPTWRRTAHRRGQ